MARLQPSAWPEADLSATGVPTEDHDLASAPAAELAQGLNACKNGQAYLDWRQFQYALAVHDRVAAQIAQEKLEAVAHSLLDVDAQAALQIQLGLESTQYAAHMLLEDAFAARDRLPRCGSLLRIGRIDRRRFHKLVIETDLVVDPILLASIDQLIAAELIALGTGTSLSEAKTAAIARRHVAEVDPDAVRQRREDAKKRRTLVTKSLTDGMAQLTIVAAAEDIRLAEKTINTYIAGLCPNDPRTKTAARSDAAIGRVLGRVFTCQCEREDCTATLDPAALDVRAARIVVHALCDSTTLDGGDKAGYLDGYGPISADHVRELAGRDDATVHHHDLGDLCDEPEGPDQPEEQAGARLPSRPDTPDECRGDTPCPEPDFGDQDRWSASDPELPADYAPPPGWFDDPGPGLDVATADLGVLVAADPGRDRVDELLDRVHERPPAIELDLLYGPDPDEPGPCPDRVISRTALPSDGYRPNTLTDLVARFLWGTCSIPGCERAAFSCDLDHVTEYDNICPQLGGPTCLCNLLPKCRFHHLAKTHLEGFVDELWRAPDGRYRSAVTVSGLTVEAVAANQWLIPQLAWLRCRHQLAGTTATGVTVAATAAEGDSGRVRTRAQNKHARRRAERNRNRRDREAAQAAAEARAAAEEQARQEAYQRYLDESDEPPF